MKGLGKAGEKGTDVEIFKQFLIKNIYKMHHLFVRNKLKKNLKTKRDMEFKRQQKINTNIAIKIEIISRIKLFENK